MSFGIHIADFLRPIVRRLVMAAVVATVVMSSLSDAEQLLDFDTPEQRAFFESLTHEFRCLKCQNQTLADSSADLAGDLRNEIHLMVLDGRTKSEITDFLLQRYGDFVLYRPRVTSMTFLLWFGPALLLVLAVLWAYLHSRSRSSPRRLVVEEQATGLESSSASDELAAARSLLDQKR